MTLEKEFEAFWNMPPNERLSIHVPEITTFYGTSKQVPIIKGKCSYCGLDIEFPYPQHEECIRIQIEVEKNALH